MMRILSGMWFARLALARAKAFAERLWLAWGVPYLVTSKRDSSTACPGASRKGKNAGHSARNDDVRMSRAT